MGTGRQVAALAGQALADIAGLPDAAPPALPAHGDAAADGVGGDSGGWAERAHAEAEAKLGPDYWGRVCLAAARVRPSSPDPVDMLLVM